MATDIEFFILTRRFLFMLMLCIIFDNRDIAVDKIRGLRSLATDLSVETMRYLIYSIFLILFATILFMASGSINRWLRLQPIVAEPKMSWWLGAIVFLIFAAINLAKGWRRRP